MNKWCVTGTPVGKSLNDLYGLLLFLQLDPYKVEAWWRLAVYTPYCLGDRGPMLEVITIVIDNLESEVPYLESNQNPN